MSRRFLALVSVLVSTWLTAGSLSGQTQSAAGKSTATKTKSWTARTPDGQPDLQGRWSNQTPTPLERPAALAGRQFLTGEEVAAQEADAKARFERPTDRPVTSRPGDSAERIVGTYNSFWSDRGRPTNRTSLIIDPPEGRVPLTDEARKLAALPGARSGWEWAYNSKVDRADSWLDRNLWERCITRGLPGAMLPAFYNHTYQILQPKGYVVILVEMIHDARIIPLDGRPHLPQGVRQWLGDSRGHWEGDTLVVETTNFTDKVTDRTKFVFGSGESSRLVERFTRVDADTIDYQFTFEDPKTFSRPWTASIPMNRIDTPIYPFECHEGNYALPDILAGARAQEKADTEAVKNRSK